MEVSPALLSIVLPVKEDFAGLSESLRCLSGLRRRVEIIVVDGTDSDGTAVRRHFAQAPWDVLLVGAQAGVYDAMNRGVAAASGGYVMFCGAGDCVDAEVLGRWLEVEASPDHAAQMHAFAVDMGSDREGGVPAVRRPHWNWRLAWQNTLHHQGLLMPRKWLLAEPFDTQYKVLADYHWALKMHKRRRPIQLNRATLTRCASGGLSRRFDWALYREEWAVKRSILPAWQVMMHGVWLPAKWAYKRLLNPAS